jgi:hypothetical protein
MCVRLTRFAPPADRPSRKANPPRQLAAKGGAAAAAAKENAATRASALKVRPEMMMMSHRNHRTCRAFHASGAPRRVRLSARRRAPRAARL